LSTTSANPYLPVDESLPNISAQLEALHLLLGVQLLPFTVSFRSSRQATNEDLVDSTAQTVIASAPVGVPAPLNVLGSTYPMQDVHVQSEVAGESRY
jgi:hypothetical protein